MPTHSHFVHTWHWNEREKKFSAKTVAQNLKETYTNGDERTNITHLNACICLLDFRTTYVSVYTCDGERTVLGSLARAFILFDFARIFGRF